MNSITYTPFGSNYECVMEGWEPKENEDGVIYFSNSHRKSTSWTHPYLDKIFEEICEYNEIRYAAYRTALKLRCLQLKSGLSWITLRGIKKILTSTNAEPEESYRESSVSHKEAFKIVVSILEASNNLCLHRAHFAKAADIIVNLMIELYDTSYEGKLALSSLKISLVALCSAQLSEKYRFFYSEVYSYDEKILQRERLLFLFYDLMQIVDVLKESTAFGTNISVAVDSCLNYHLAPSETGRSAEDTFYSWLLLEPQIIVWLPTLHRVAASENVCHDVQCSSCGLNPLKGFRYRCLQCFKYDLCQKCFFHGNMSLTHKLKHPMQEYCLPATKKDNTKAVFKILRNKLSKKHRSQSKISYLPLDDDSITGAVLQWQPRHSQPNPKQTICGSNDSGLACYSESDGVASLHSSHPVIQGTRIVVNSNNFNDAEEKDDGDQLSRKDMIDQQFIMTKKIEDLQEENKYLYEKLKVLTVQKSSINSDNHSDVNGTCEVTGNETLEEESKEANLQQSGDNLSSIIISAIEYESPNERETINAKRRKSRASEIVCSDEDSLPDIIEIVGYNTPIRSSFCENSQHEPNVEGVDETKIKEKEEEDVRNNINNKSSMDHTYCEPSVYKTEANVHNHFDGKEVRSANVSRDDAISESTASDGLEYGFSDMSLNSDNLSQRISLKGRETPVRNSVIENARNSEVQSSLKTPQNEILAYNKDDVSRVNQNANGSGQLQENQEPEPVMTVIRREPIQMEQMSQNTEMNTDELFFNLSDILAEGSAFPAFSDMSQKLHTPVTDEVPERRLTLEPVYMSTPLTGGGQPQLSELATNRAGKENKVPSRRKEGPLQLVALYHNCGKRPSGVTPKSAVVSSRQNKRLLSSRENLSTNCTVASVDFSHRDMGMTTMFDKAERLGALEATNVGDSLAYADKEEMEKLCHIVNTTNSAPEYHQTRQKDDSSSSMLTAVLNVGDAMADLVQASSDVQQK